jgi:hypothetical protein
MATYAQLADVSDYGVVIDDPVEAENLLEVCERELDMILIRNTWSSDWALRIDPALLLPFQATMLNRAACAQFEYHIAMGEDFFLRPQPAQVRQPEGGGYVGSLSAIGPKVYRELGQSDLVSLTGDLDSYGQWSWGMAMDPFWWQRTWLPPARSYSRTFNNLTRLSPWR